MEIKEQIRIMLDKALSDFRAAGTVPADVEVKFNVEIPRNRQHGDYCTNMPFLLAKVFKKAPVQVAQICIDQFDRSLAPAVGKIEAAPNGYLNFILSMDTVIDTLKAILDQGEKYGTSTFGKGQKVQIEFVSANPTGPLNVVSARAASVGDSLASILKTAGYEVAREFYVNDYGVQARLFGETLKARYLQVLGQDCPIPENGYQGEYVVTLAQQALESGWFPKDPKEALDYPVEEYSKLGLEKMLESQKSDLDSFGVQFDCWFRESWLHRDGKPAAMLAHLKNRGLTYEKEGATWLKTTEYGDSEDRVLIKSDGNPTYFLNDIAYHHDKFERGFQSVIDLWGPDHHGHVIRMKAALKAVGHEEPFDVLIVQQVNLLRNGERVKMSKRAGKIETMKDLVQEIGVDAARFFFLMRGTDSHLDFDLEVAKYQTNDNPVFYVQYAHARVCSIFAQAQSKGFDLPTWDQVDLNLLSAPEEAEIIKVMASYPQIIGEAAQACEPHRLVRYLMDLATRLHGYYNCFRIISEDKELSRARLVFMRSVQQVLANGLTLMGVSRPDKM